MRSSSSDAPGISTEETSVIERTTIACTAGRHTIRRLKGDLFYVAEAARLHPNLDAEVEAFQVAAALGVNLPAVHGCVPMLALLRGGIADIIDQDLDDRDPSGWSTAWKRYRANPLVNDLRDRLVRQLRAAHKGLLKSVTKALPRSSRLPLAIKLTDSIGDHADQVVGFYMEDDWKLPVASDWLTTCAKDPHRDGKLVLGRTSDAVYVLANDRAVSDAWYVRKMAA
jgi:hypothetical protein